MESLLRESPFGRLLNTLTKNLAFPYPESPPHDPDTSTTISESLHKTNHQEVNLIGWTGPDDPANPLNWSTTVKLIVTFDVMLLNFTFYVAAAVFTPSTPDIEAEFGVSDAAGTLGLSLFVIAYGVGPLVLSPLSNIPSIGRTPVYLVGLFCFFILQIGTARAENIQTVLVLRFLAGFFGSAPISVGGATLSEIYRPEQRAYAISMYAVSGVASPVLGPIIGALAVSRWHTWTAPLWLLAGLSAFALTLLFFLLPETLYDNILFRRAQRLRARTGIPTFRCQAELDRADASLAMTILKQCLDDLKISLVEPIVLFVNLHTMLLYSLLYLWFEFFPFVFGGIYGFSQIQQSLAFFGILVGAVISVIAYTLWLRYSYAPLTRKLGASIEPEARLLPAQLGAVCIPICLLYSLGRRDRGIIHWIVPILGTSFFAPGFYLTFQSVLNYLGDVYPRYAASVFAGNTFFRSSIAGALPLAAPAMLRSLGIGWASSVLGFISVVMGLGPFVAARYGKRIRVRSQYAC